MIYIGFAAGLLCGVIIGMCYVISNPKEERYSIDELRTAMHNVIPTLFGMHRPYDYDRIIQNIIIELTLHHGRKDN